MRSVAQLDDEEGDRLVRLAESLGGEQDLSEGERWRLRVTLDRRRRQEAAAAQPRATDALAAQRIETIESWIRWLRQKVETALPEVFARLVVEIVRESEERTTGEAKGAITALRDETDQKLSAQYDGFEQVVRQLRDDDRRALFENLREALSDAEARIDAGFSRALEGERERAELELALTRDELLALLAEKKFGQLDDADPKLAERAVRGLRRELKATVEKEERRYNAITARFDETTARLAGVENAHRNLLTRTGASIVAAQSAGKRVDEQANKIAALEETMSRLLETLLARKLIE
jgi:hypothetical protein